jgi:hypothetical protein
MPEPILGLTLCNLYKGHARQAQEWISQSIGRAIEILKAAEPDAVEWAYFITSLLCQGDIWEARRRAHQFPFLQHQELERCRWVVDALNRSNLLSWEQHHKQTTVTARPSIHQLPQRDMASWVMELCKMLTACGQGALAEQLDKRFRWPPTQPVLLTRRLRSRLISSNRSKSILPLTSKPLHVRIRQWIPSRVRAQMRGLFVSVQSLRKNCTNEFASATQALARDEPADSALILGASDRSTYTHAFLEGVRQNPSLPMVLCVASSNCHFKDLERRFANYPRIQFMSSPLDVLVREKKMECFDIVLIDDYTPSERETFEPLTGTKTVLIGNVNTYLGYRIARSLLSDTGYKVAYESMSLTGSIIFTARHRVPCDRKQLHLTPLDGGPNELFVSLSAASTA